VLFFKGYRYRTIGTSFFMDVLLKIIPEIF
jgi:hypothetical protein